MIARACINLFLVEKEYFKIYGMKKLISTRSLNFKSALLSSKDVMAFAQIASAYIT